MGDGLPREAQLFEDDFPRGRGSESLDSNGIAPVSHGVAPTLRHSGFHGQLGNLRRKHPSAIVLRLLVEQFNGGHGDDPCTDPLSRQYLLSVQGRVNLRAGSYQNDFGRPSLGFRQNVAAPGDSLSDAAVCRIEHGDLLACKRQDERPFLADHYAPGRNRFIGVGGTQNSEAGNESKARDMLHWLMGGPVFAQADRVVCKDEEGVSLHQGRQPQCGAHVVGEDQESGTVGNDAAVQRHAVQHPPHGVFADTEVDVASPVFPQAEVSLTGQKRFRGRSQVRRATYQVLHTLGQRVHGFAARFAGRNRAVAGFENRQIFVPIFGKPSGPRLLEEGSEVGVGALIRFKELVPLGLLLCPSLTSFLKVSRSFFRDMEG